MARGCKFLHTRNLLCFNREAANFPHAGTTAATVAAISRISTLHQAQILRRLAQSLAFWVIPGHRLPF
jgi:hypothetical protein